MYVCLGFGKYSSYKHAVLFFAMDFSSQPGYKCHVK